MRHYCLESFVFQESCVVCPTFCVNSLVSQSGEAFWTLRPANSPKCNNATVQFYQTGLLSSFVLRRIALYCIVVHHFAIVLHRVSPFCIVFHQFALCCTILHYVSP